jgi:hypothetical protein
MFTAMYVYPFVLLLLMHDIQMLKDKRNHVIFGEEKNFTYFLGKLGQFDVWFDFDQNCFGDGDTPATRENAQFQKVKLILDRTILSALDYLRSTGSTVYTVYFNNGENNLNDVKRIELGRVKLIKFVKAVQAVIGSMERSFNQSRQRILSMRNAHLQKAKDYEALFCVKMKLVIRELGQDHQLDTTEDPNGERVRGYTFEKYLNNCLDLHSDLIKTVKVYTYV